MSNFGNIGKCVCACERECVRVCECVCMCMSVFWHLHMYLYVNVLFFAYIIPSCVITFRGGISVCHIMPREIKGS